MSDLTVSIVMGDYNGARFIEEQIASLLAQSRPPFEIIVADDGSTDETAAIVQRVAERASVPIRYHRNERNLGFGENFLQACTRATGDLIAFCDQDDVWENDKLARCAAAFADPAVTMCVHRSTQIDADGQPIGSFGQGIDADRTREPLSYNPWYVFFGFSMVFRRRLLDLVPMSARPADFILGDGTPLAHDRWVMFLATATGRVREITAPLVRYRQHGNNVFGSGRMGGPRTRRDMHARFDAYIGAASGFIDVVPTLCSAAPSVLGREIDRAALTAWWRRALDQQRARQRVYAGGRVGGVGQVLANLLRRQYRRVHDGAFDRRAVARDILAARMPR